MNISELKSKKLPDLRDIARSLGLKGYSGLKKQDLIYLILETEAEVESTRREAPASAGASSKGEKVPGRRPRLLLPKTKEGGIRRKTEAHPRGNSRSQLANTKITRKMVKT